MTKDYPWGKGTPKWVRDATANDSDKSFTVPAGKVWDFKEMMGYLVCTATVGSRSLRIDITDGTNILYSSNAVALTASQAGTIEMHCEGNYAATSTAKQVFGVGAINAGAQIGTNRKYLTAGMVVRIWDTAAIDAAADDLTVALAYLEYDV